MVSCDKEEGSQKQDISMEQLEPVEKKEPAAKQNNIKETDTSSVAEPDAIPEPIEKDTLEESDVYEPGPGALPDDNLNESEAADTIHENINIVTTVDSLEIVPDSADILNDAEEIEHQEVLANQLFEEISTAGRNDIGLQKRLYREIIDQCPDTKEAQIAYYRLANIFLFEESEADYRAVVKLLKDFPTRYPKSGKMSVIVPLLIRAYEETEQWGEIVGIYSFIFSQNISLKNKDLANHYFNYAQALENTGNKTEALTWYKKTIEVGPGGGNSYIISLAKQKVEALEK